MKCLFACLALATTQTACIQCQPTDEQQAWCEALHGFGFVAMGRVGTEGLCTPQDVQCVRGSTVTVGLAQADAQVDAQADASACTPIGALTDATGPTDAGPSDAGPSDAGPDAAIEWFCPQGGQP